MSWLVFVLPEAERDLAAARDWYERKRHGLGDEFLDEVTAAVVKLRGEPRAERLYHRNFRRALLRRFPYKLFYQVIGERAVIFRVLHARQRHEEKLRGD